MFNFLLFAHKCATFILTNNDNQTNYDCIYEKQYKIATQGRFVRHITLQHKTPIFRDYFGF